MIKIGIEVESNLKILLKEVLNYNLIDIQRDENEIDKIAVLIIDINIPNVKEKIKKYYELGIPIILVLGKENIREMREYFLGGQIKDCILRQDIFKLEESIQAQINSPQNYKSFYLCDTYQKGILDFDEVIYISYSSVSRKTEFHLKNAEIFSIKSNFSEIEEKINSIKDFAKLDRGTIINISLIKILDYKEERIIFKDNSHVYTSKAKLKELEEKYNFGKGRIIF